MNQSQKFIIYALLSLIALTSLVIFITQYMTSKDIPNNNGEIPKGCTSWYDGCNTCSVKNGKLEACTLMYCETPGKTKCVVYK